MNRTQLIKKSKGVTRKDIETAYPQLVESGGFGAGMICTKLRNAQEKASKADWLTAFRRFNRKNYLAPTLYMMIKENSWGFKLADLIAIALNYTNQVYEAEIFETAKTLVEKNSLLVIESMLYRSIPSTQRFIAVVIAAIHYEQIKQFPEARWIKISTSSGEFFREIYTEDELATDIDELTEKLWNA